MCRQELTDQRLKPANIKIDLEDKVKILDFGLAKALSDPASPEGATLEFIAIGSGNEEPEVNG